MAIAFLSLVTLVNLPLLEVSSTMFRLICWDIWTARNINIFEGKSFSQAEIIAKAIWLAREWLQEQAAQKMTNHLQVRQSLEVSRSSITATLGFTNAVWYSINRTAGCGWLKNFSEKIIEIAN